MQKRKLLKQWGRLPLKKKKRIILHRQWLRKIGHFKYEQKRVSWVQYSLILNKFSKIRKFFKKFKLRWSSKQNILKNAKLLKVYRFFDSLSMVDELQFFKINLLKKKLFVKYSYKKRGILILEKKRLLKALVYEEAVQKNLNELFTFKDKSEKTITTNLFYSNLFEPFKKFITNKLNVIDIYFILFNFFEYQKVFKIIKQLLIFKDKDAFKLQSIFMQFYKYNPNYICVSKNKFYDIKFRKIYKLILIIKSDLKC